MTSSPPPPYRQRWFWSERAAHFDRAFYRPGFAFSMHVHDYAEVFFVERGRGTHHFADGSHPLEEGDLVFVAPEDAHYLAADADVPLVFVNIAFPLETWRTIVRRYCEIDPEGSWSSAGAHRAYRLEGDDQRALIGWLGRLEAAHERVTKLEVEAGIIDLLARIARRRAAAVEGEGLPDWLREALPLLDEPRVLRAGVSAFCARTGRGREHVNRQLRRHLGCTTVELLTRRRMAYATRRLQQGTDPVSAIADACGFASLSHFHRVFAREHGCTPAAWRRKNRTAYV
jgi:AraC family cel operon transcriptional repressor